MFNACDSFVCVCVSVSVFSDVGERWKISKHSKMVVTIEFVAMLRARSITEFARTNEIGTVIQTISLYINCAPNIDIK